MGRPSTEASNAIIYLTYGLFLVFGLVVAWTLRKQSKAQYLASNRTQKGVPLALNFIASALGSGILFTYPEIATIAGVQGVVVYALSSALPLIAFAALGPIIRRKCPQGFVLTEWARERFGLVTALYLSLMTLITLFLYMVAELSALQQIVHALTGLSGLPALVVEGGVTAIYTSLGGFKVSFITDNVQGAMVVGLIIIGVIAVGVETNIDTSLIAKSHYLDASLLGWQLIYILPVAILTNNFFLSSLWLRTFASKTDKDLWIGVSIATIAVLIILTLVGVTGLLAGWSGAYKLDDQNGYLSFFLLLRQLPAWVVGIVLVMVVALSTSAFDSFVSAMVSTGSNDFFRNKLNIWFIRACMVIIMIPTIIVALKSPDVLQIYLISDLVSAALIPVLMLGLWDKMYWLRGFEVVVGGLGGILSIFIFGLVYYSGNAERAAKLIILEKGLYIHDWSAFGAFVAAPIGGLLWACGACGLRLLSQWIYAKIKGQRFDALDRPVEVVSIDGVYGSETNKDDEEQERLSPETVQPGKSGKFF